MYNCKCALIGNHYQNTHMYVLHDMQFEQEFGLILGQSKAKQDFVTEWCTKYIPAVISYGKRSTKHAIEEILEKLDTAGI